MGRGQPDSEQLVHFQRRFSRRIFLYQFLRRAYVNQLVAQHWKEREIFGSIEDDTIEHCLSDQSHFPFFWCLLS